MNCSNIIVADENIPILVIRGLRARGCDIVSIVEEARGCSDEIVLDISIKHKAVLVSFDKEFGSRVYRNIPGALCGFVLLRIPPLSPEYILKTLEWLIFESGIELKRNYIVIDKSKVRSFPMV